jgi:hypothetical protein
MRDTIEMAREVKATAYTNRHYPDRTTYTFGPEQLKAFEALVRADEREACLGIAESKRYAPNFQLTSIPLQNGTAVGIAAAIRARGNT